MAHFAELDSNNIVLRVVVVSNDDVDANGGDYSSEAETFVSNLIPYSENGVAWKQTSYNGSQRKQYAGLEYKYDSGKDKFICPQPFPSWTLDSDDDWQAPVTPPNQLQIGDDDVSLSWNEDNSRWDGRTYDISTDPVTITNYTWDADNLQWNEV